MRADWSRWAALLGVPYFVLWVLGFVFSGSTPDSNASAEHAVSYFEAHRTHDRIGLFFLIYGAIFALMFAAALRSFLKGRSRGDGLITLGFSGMVIFAVGVCTILGTLFAATDVPGKISPAAEQALNVLQNDMFFAFLVGTGIFLIGNGLAIVAEGALPKWLGWVAVPLAVIAVTPLGWFVALFALPIWSLIVTVLMYLRTRPAVAAPVTA